MSRFQALFAVIVALCVGYVSGYSTYLVQWPQRSRPSATGPGAQATPPVTFVHPVVAQVEKARKLQEAGQSEEARKILEEQVRLYSKAPEAGPARQLLGAINAGLFFSEKSAFGKVEYIVQPGDSLARIAHKLKSTPEMIMRANDLSSTMIHVGDKLMIPDGGFTLLVDLPAERVVVRRDGKFFKEYPIQTVRVPRSSQPQVMTKVTGNTYWKNGERIAPGKVDLTSATTWVQMANPSYILYGAESDETGENGAANAGSPAGAGALRADVPARGVGLFKGDLAELQLFLNRGTPVTILCEHKLVARH